MAMNTVPQYKDGNNKLRDAYNHPIYGPTTQSRNRNQIDVTDTYAAATNSMTWNTADNITELTIYPTYTGQAVAITDPTALQQAYVAVCFNAGSDAIAGAWLDLTLESETDDIQWYKIPIGVPTVFRFTSAVTRADFAVESGLMTANKCDIWVGAN